MGIVSQGCGGKTGGEMKHWWSGSYEKVKVNMFNGDPFSMGTLINNLSKDYPIPKHTPKLEQEIGGIFKRNWI